MLTVHGFCHQAGNGCFAYPPRASKQIGMGQALGSQLMQECFCNMALPNNLIKLLGPVFAVECLCHALHRIYHEPARLARLAFKRPAFARMAQRLAGALYTEIPPATNAKNSYDLYSLWMTDMA